MKNIRNRKHLATLLSFLVLLAVSILPFSACDTQNAGQKRESLLDKILREKKIRCMYINYPPTIQVDPNTKQLSGIFYDVVKRFGEDTALEIEWVGETTWGTMIEDLKNDKYDLLVTGVFPTAVRAKESEFTKPILYIGMGAVVRVGETRFKTVEDFNAPNVTIATVDGEVGDAYVKQFLPKANRQAIPTGEIPQAVDQVAYKKADVAITDMLSAGRYVMQHRDAVYDMFADKPIRVYGASMMTKRGEFEFLHLLDVALDEYINSGFIDSLDKKYKQAPNEWLPAAKMFGRTERAQ